MDVLVDLDGTLIDPKPGLIGSIQYALDRLGHPVPPAEDLLWMIGPPFRVSFPTLLGTVDRIEEAIGYYRENYLNGAMYDAVVYDGIPAALDALRTAGCRLFVATAKPHYYARPILERFDLARHFVGIHGPELDGTNDHKHDLIAPHYRRGKRAPGDGAHDRRPRARCLRRSPQRHAHGRRNLGLRHHRRADGRGSRCALPLAYELGRNGLTIVRRTWRNAATGPIVALLSNCRTWHPI